MSLDRRCELVEKFREMYGLNACLKAMGISKGTWYPRRKRTPKIERDRELLGTLREAIEEHPEYGYRKLKPEVEERLEKAVNHKRLLRVLSDWSLGLRRLIGKHTPSRIRRILKEGAGLLNLVRGWKPAPLELLSGDFTEIVFDGGRRKAYLMGLIDVGSCLMCGWAVGRRSNRALALLSWEKATSTLRDLGRSMAGMVLHTDKDSVFTSYDWLRQVIVKDGAVVSFSERGATDNPWIESFWSHFKQENASLLMEATSIEELERIINQRIWYYNESRRHATLGNVPPVSYLEEKGMIRESLSAA